MSQDSPQPTESTPTSEAVPDPNDDTIKTLMDLAVKRHEALEKAYDTMNTRVGVIFGFSGFLATAYFKALDFLPVDWARTPAAIIFGIAVFALAHQCRLAFKVTNFHMLPEPRALARDFAYRTPEALRLQLLSQLADDYSHNKVVYDRKADRLQAAISVMFVQAGLILALLLVAGASRLPPVRHRLAIVEAARATVPRTQERTMSDDKKPAPATSTPKPDPLPAPKPDYVDLLRKDDSGTGREKK